MQGAGALGVLCREATSIDAAAGRDRVGDLRDPAALSVMSGGRSLAVPTVACIGVLPRHDAVDGRTLGKRTGKRSDKTSDNHPRQRQIWRDVPRRHTWPGLRQPDAARRHQTKPACMACRRSGVRIPLAPPFFVCMFEKKTLTIWALDRDLTCANAQAHIAM